MAITNHERIGKALDVLKAGLGPFVERELVNANGADALSEALRLLGEDRPRSKKKWADLDAAALLKVMWESWNDVFARTLGPAERTFVREIRDARNRWAHQDTFSGDDAYRALDNVSRLLAAISAPQSEEIERSKTELLRTRFEEQVRSEKRRTAGTAIETQAAGNLKPWREVVSPHHDVASGQYQQAEFAADLWQVHLGEGTAEYRDPTEFFRRTYLTESLKQLLVGAVQRLTGGGGDPVVQLQTNFGGGKTHSMLALYHLVSGTPPSGLPGVDAVLAEAGVKSLPNAKRVVLVGNKISPGNPVKKPDGTIVRTLWGELAWQLGGKKAYNRIREDDEKGTSPGDVLRDLFNEHAPCLILIDEWVAYARQLHDGRDLPAGTFETQFTFAQALTESAKLAKKCMLVISLPASDSATHSPHIQADNVEVGGQRGREALDRLRNVVGRLDSPWRPASAEEGFEIVRRRLFEPLVDKAQFVARDSVARDFFDLYRTQHQEFPPECKDAEYEKRLRAAYPIHPEVFDRLYMDWSTLVKFQRTRGVLRLMAAVIHSLWEKGDRNPLIMPSMIPIDDPRVQFELTRYLSDNWVPVIEKDVDGPSSLPLRQDAEVPNLGKFAASRRVARTIYLGSAPTGTAANRGVEDRRVKLGCVIPGESPAVFGDALRRLAATATYLYQDPPRYWYSTQPTVTKLAEDRAEQLKREPDKVTAELERRLRANLTKKGDFSRIHPLPHSGQDVPDDLDARLVVLGIDHCHSKEQGTEAEAEANAILESRGNSPRLYRNSLVFLAPDTTRLQDLDEAVRYYLAWDEIVSRQTELDLSPHQVKQAQSQLKTADETVETRIPETYQWLLVPGQETPQAPTKLTSFRLTGREELAVRASKKLRNDELMITTLGASSLKMYLDRVPLWRGNHVSIKQLVDDFGRYLYLPRLVESAVLLGAMSDGFSMLTWEKDSFAYAESYDEAGGRYVGLGVGRSRKITDVNSPGLLVKPDVARAQLDAEITPKPPESGDSPMPGPTSRPGAGPRPGVGAVPPPVAPRPKRFHGTVALDTTRMGRDAGRICDEIVAHLAGIVGANVKVTLDIEAEVPGGAPENVVRTVTENSRTLKFTSHGFEEE